MSTKSVMNVLKALVMSVILLCSTAYSMDVKDAEKIDSVVKEHLAAVATKNYNIAYQTLSPEVQNGLKLEEFKEAVKTNLEFLSSATAIEIQGPELVSGEVVMLARVTSGKGAVWIVAFKLSPQKDGSWKIDECLIVPTNTIAS